MRLMYQVRTSPRTAERNVESMMRRVAEKMLCEAEGRKKARRRERGVADELAAGAVGVSEATGVPEATRASGSGLESSFVDTV